MSWDHTRSPFARWVLDDAGAGLVSYLPLQEDGFGPSQTLACLTPDTARWGTTAIDPSWIGRSPDGPTTGDVGGLRVEGTGTARTYAACIDGLNAATAPGRGTFATWARVTSPHTSGYLSMARRNFVNSGWLFALDSSARWHANWN